MQFLAVNHPRGRFQTEAGARRNVLPVTPGGTLLTTKPIVEAATEAEAAALLGLVPWAPPAPPPAPETPEQVAAARFVAEGALKAGRDARLAAGFAYGGKRIQTRNETDRLNVIGAAVAAAADPAFLTGWITEDNSVLVLDAAGVQAMHATMVATANAVWTLYAQRRAALEAATTLAAVAAVPTTFPEG